MLAKLNSVKNLIVEYYAIFLGAGEGKWKHVIMAEVFPDGKVEIYDPQASRHYTSEEFLNDFRQRYGGKAKSYLLE